MTAPPARTTDGNTPRDDRPRNHTGRSDSSEGRSRLVHDAFFDARTAAFPVGQYVGQQSFMAASEILTLTAHAGIEPDSTVLDLCCGVAGPGQLIAQRTGCSYVGIDADPAAIAIARERCRGLPCRFEVGRIPPLPPSPASDGKFDVVVLFETLLAFRDKPTLIAAISGALRPGGRFACTIEAGPPLTDAERSVMPDADTVWPIPVQEFTTLLADHGLVPSFESDCTGAHLAVVEALVREFTERRAQLAPLVGAPAVGRLLAGHRLWESWFQSGRMRKVALVAQRV